MEIIYGVMYGLLGQVGSFMQLQGAMKLGWFPKYFWPVLLMSVPLSWLYIKSVEHFLAAFDGQLWPSRLIGFGLGIAIFSIMSHFMFKEPLTPKTLVCVGLGLIIIAIQVIWK